MSAGGGSLPGNAAVKQEGNISREVSEGPGKEKERSKRTALSQHATQDGDERCTRRCLREAHPQPSHQHEALHKVQSVLFSTSLPAMLAGIFLIFVRFFIPGVLVLTTHHVVYTNVSRGCREPGSV